jgi:metallo-beta-lactamase family protein
MRLQFFGAARTVTGSKHLLTLDSGKKILLDCGMFQGRGKDTFTKNSQFPFTPGEVDYIVLSHAHIDHSGVLPKLVKEGFRGNIYCTSGTADLCEIMLLDSAHIQVSDAEFINKRRKEEGKDTIEPLYTVEDVYKTLPLFKEISYNHEFKIDDEASVTFTDAGHILGSAVVNLKIKEGNQIKKLAFTGDIGRYINKVLRVPQPFPQADFIICEGTYGDRKHDTIATMETKLQQVVEETCLIKKGKLIVPAFSIGKTQELVFCLNKLNFEGKLPKIKVYVDSPLAINATEIMKRHSECFSPETLEFMKKDPDPFGFNGLEYVRDKEASQAINRRDEPCIIISASGMANAGRIRHHLRNEIGNPRNSVLIIGFAEGGSLADRIARGDKYVPIFGQDHGVKADVYKTDFFSAHADYEELTRFLTCQNPDLVKKLFLVHGNEEVLLNFKDKLLLEGYRSIQVPREEEEFRV